jgi:hypothetical protein
MMKYLEYSMAVYWDAVGEAAAAMFDVDEEEEREPNRLA